MANIINPGTYHPRRVNQYVKAMQYSSDVNYGGATRVSFGPVAVVAPNNIVNAQPIDKAITLDLTNLPDMIAPYGRCITLTGNAAVAAGSAITVRGWDYLGQPMTEVFTTVAGVTPMVGFKAFKTFNSVTIAANAGTAPVLISIGQNAKLGLPYRAIGQRLETNAGVPAATQGTFVFGPMANPSNAVGAPDPRGTYQPSFAPNGATNISAHFDFANDLFGTPGGAAPNDAGGLHGFPHAG